VCERVKTIVSKLLNYMREVVQRELNVTDIRRLQMHMDVLYGNDNSE